MNGPPALAQADGNSRRRSRLRLLIVACAAMLAAVMLSNSWLSIGAAGRFALGILRYAVSSNKKAQLRFWSARLPKSR